MTSAKIDSHFTFSDDPPDGQVSRYLEFLANSNASQKALIVICPHFNTDWYLERMRSAVDDSKTSIPTYIIEWDGVFAINRG